MKKPAISLRLPQICFGSQKETWSKLLKLLYWVDFRRRKVQPRELSLSCDRWHSLIPIFDSLPDILILLSPPFLKKKKGGQHFCSLNDLSMPSPFKAERVFAVFADPCIQTHLRAKGYLKCAFNKKKKKGVVWQHRAGLDPAVLWWRTSSLSGTPLSSNKSFIFPTKQWMEFLCSWQCDLIDNRPPPWASLTWYAIGWHGTLGYHASFLRIRTLKSYVLWSTGELLTLTAWIILCSEGRCQLCFMTGMCVASFFFFAAIWLSLKS